MTTPDAQHPDKFYWRGGQRFVHLKFAQTLFDNDLIVETPRGGLVLGPAHTEQGIQVIQVHDKEVYWVAEFEGWEYIINPFGTESHYQEIEKINSAYGHNPYHFEEYSIPKEVNLLDCRPKLIAGKLTPKWMLKGVGTQWIVTREATKHNLQRLHEINELTWKKAMKQ